MVIVADLRAERIVLWNPAAEALFGYSTAEALELPLERLVPDRLRAHYRDRLIAYRATGQDPLLDPSGLVELPALCKTGEEITLEVTLTRLGPAAGAGDLVLAAARDRTARRQVGVQRDALLRVARLAGQVDADELLTNLLHEAVATVGGDSGGVYI